MKQLDDYLNAKQQVYNYFGFVESRVICPIDDCRKYFWKLDGSTIKFADSEQELDSESGNYFEVYVYEQHSYKKHVYESPEYTMIFVDTQTNGQKYFAIWENAKKR